MNGNVCTDINIIYVRKLLDFWCNTKKTRCVVVHVLTVLIIVVVQDKKFDDLIYSILQNLLCYKIMEEMVIFCALGINK